MPNAQAETAGIDDRAEAAVPLVAPVVPPQVGEPGLIAGTGGLVGNLGQLLDSTTSGLLGGDGYVRNGDLSVINANFEQGYAASNVLGVPVVNITPVGTLLDGVGNAVTGGNSHLTLIGGVTSDSYIYNINNGDSGGLLGLLLPSNSPTWASQCANLLGVINTDCWAINAAQDYQVLIGDGAFANGSKEVVIGTDARHELPAQDANMAFPGTGRDNVDNPTGVPTADYDARRGHSVVVGDGATGNQNAQTLIGAGATSNKANAVALGYLSNADRGSLENYDAFGLDVVQSSVGEVAIGSVGRERQITHVAAASEATDAVNLSQLQGALAQINQVDVFAVTYASDGNGDPDYSRVALGDTATSPPTTISNLAAGVVTADSTEAINGAQLYALGLGTAANLGGGSSVDANGVPGAPNYEVNSFQPDGSIIATAYNNVGDALSAISQSLGRIDVNAPLFAVTYGADANGDPDYARVVLGPIAASTPTMVGNLASGTVAADSAEAINGAQLYALGLSTAANLGGGSTLDADGVPGAPRYVINRIGADGSVTSGSYDNVGGALDAISQSLGQIDVNAPDTLAVHYLADASGNATNQVALSGDGTGAAVGLSNIADGALAAGSRDAVSGGQLFTNNGELARFLGGTAAFDGATAAWVGPQFAVSGFNAAGDAATTAYGDATSAFAAVDGSLQNLNNRVLNLSASASPYLTVNSIDAAPTAGGAEAVALGPAAVARGDAGLALGGGASAVAAGSVALGSGALAKRANSVSVGVAGGERQIVNVAAGAVVADGTDAVNGGQLFQTHRQLASYLGGTTRYDGDSGTWTGPGFQITSVAVEGDTHRDQYDNVNSAFGAVDGSLVNLNQRVQNLQDSAASRYVSVRSDRGPAAGTGVDAVAIGPEAAATADDSVALGAGAVADRAHTVSVGAAGAERQLTNVADGTAETDAVNLRQLEASYQSNVRYDADDGRSLYGSVTLGQGGRAAQMHNVAAGVADTDAVNVGQLRAGVVDAMDWSKRYTDSRIERLDNHASAGVASAMAMASLPQPYEAGRSMASFAASTFNGESGFALGLAGVTEGGRWVYRLSGATNTRGKGGMAVGAAIQW